MRVRVLLLGLILALASPAAAQDAPSVEVPDPKSLDELLELVTKGFRVERKENREREKQFLAAKDEQQRLLDEALATLRAAEGRSQALEERYNANETAIAENEEQLRERLGQMGELFGVVRQVATDLSGQAWESLIGSQLGDRRDLLDRLGRSKELPSTEDLEKLWIELQREMTEQGRIARYPAPVLTLAGNVEEKTVVRAGPFAAITDGRYLHWESGEQKFRELNRQPPGKYLGTVGPFEGLDAGFGRLAVDPSKGSLLTALIDTPSRTERIQQGGAVGAVIITLGIAAFILGVIRWVYITVTSRRVAAQRKSDSANKNNPLGRVLAIYEDNRTADTETLELKLDEAVMRESSRLQRLHWLVKTVSVVAPLLGLLGTVTGMIQTFQAITLFGAGDPKMMAGGISEALVTTMLGLMTAIPLVLLHATLANSTRRILDVLDEQSAGLIAIQAEKSNVV